MYILSIEPNTNYGNAKFKFFYCNFFFNNVMLFSRILYGYKSFMNNKQQRLGGIPN